MNDRLYSKINTDKVLIIYNVSTLSILRKIMNKMSDNIRIVMVCDEKDFNQAKENEYIQEVSGAEMHDILRYYLLYEFTDKMIVISDNLQYPSMFNYIQQGLLTEEELVDALLYKIG